MTSSTRGREQVPNWLEHFCSQDFSRPCPRHGPQRKLKKYCATCEVLICELCDSEISHRNHILIQAFMLSYAFTVKLQSMHPLFDCSRIQIFKGKNSEDMVAVNPMAHAATGKGSHHFPANQRCRNCPRHLRNFDEFRYCSISCKAAVVTGVAEALLALKRTERDELVELAAEALVALRNNLVGTGHSIESSYC